MFCFLAGRFGDRKLLPSEANEVILVPYLTATACCPRETRTVWAATHALQGYFSQEVID